MSDTASIFVQLTDGSVGLPGFFASVSRHFLSLSRSMINLSIASDQDHRKWVSLIS